MLGVDVWVKDNKIGSVQLGADNSLIWIGDKDRLLAVIDPLQMFHQGEDLLRYLLTHSGTYTQFLPMEEETPAANPLATGVPSV